ncbi:MAG TPA: exonuclease SbcCD subunit D C-terminal domain-containing protein, partial [Acidimicrobiia bacterium]|nr:exonuclease SbcCD subunit D C-terminal domain-containing protein [Acidimicrobiia bacterium]
GEGGHDKHAMIVEAAAGRPAKVRQTRLDGVRRLRTIEGTLAELRARAADVEDDLLKIVVKEPARAGLADAVRELLPNAIDIRISVPAALDQPLPDRSGLTPHGLFKAFLDQEGVSDEKLEGLFARLLDEAAGGEA